MRQSSVNFFASNEYPGNSPDLNVTENMGAIVKDRMDIELEKEDGEGRYSKETLLKCIKNLLRGLQNATPLFEALLRSYPKRIAAVNMAKGGHTDY